ncbi:type VI secretion system tip protein TssI/VgrG [Polyangium jinanense]|uniref:Type VI secretion system tip protein VgrG n=1 Tax=Polyangium jinanense TaxID=2829994 RepID=A0A9X3WWI3_9BACT|nr:type VI secretion system tip protein TssI/VgrG [Polyangium jinanense]MDC3979484.1 type VI secretion system tip protein VgrG [Polyangium jinanense]
MPFFELSFDCGETSLVVRRFSIHEAVSTPFTVSLWVRSENPAVDIGAIVGQPAIFKVRSGYLNLTGGGLRVWSGYVSYMEQTHAEHRQNKVLSTYHFRIVPHLWLLDQRRNHRIFQHLSIPDIVDKILTEWNVRRAWKIDRGQYPKHEFRVQYGESDFTFVSRLLEEAGIAYTFPDVDDNGSLLTFSAELHKNPPRPGPPVPYEHNPTMEAEREFVSKVSLVRDVRPGALVLRDYDFRRPEYPLFTEAPKAGDEARFEQYHYIPGGMFVEAGRGGDTPFADDKGIARHDQPTGEKRATRALEAARADRGGISFESNLNDLTPGVVFKVDHHPHPDLARPFLTTDTILEGSAEGEWMVSGHATFADVPYRPPLVTPRPEVLGVQSVRVVAPRNGIDLDQAVHVDEFGRVRVQFPWDREGNLDDDSSCWIRVVEGWGGAGYGWLNLPRVGHELLVTFLDGDPDRPVLAGRLYNAEKPVPYKLPEHKTVSTWKSQSMPALNGYNEIKFEDQKGEELFYMQAEKNLRKLVKNDEIDTVGHVRDKLVQAWEFETVGGNRIQHTEKERDEMTGRLHHTLIKGDRRQLVRKDEIEVNFLRRRLLVKKNVDAVVKGEKRERTEWDLHLYTKENRKDRTGKDHSLFVYQEKHEKVGGDYAREAGKEIHYTAGENAVGQAPDITLKGPGGFIRIDGSGIVISGTKVDINVGGSPGHGHGSRPKEIAKAKEAVPIIGDVHVQPDSPAFATMKALWDQLVADLAVKPADVKYAALKRIEELNKIAANADVETPLNGLVLWSGKGPPIAGTVAQDFANQRSALGLPSTTLEQTPGGIELGHLSSRDPSEQKDEAWTIVSKKLATQAAGDVHIVLGIVPIPEGRIVRHEIEMLSNNPNVTSITVLQMQVSATGKYKDAGGTAYDLVPITMQEALGLKPPPPPAPEPDDEDDEEVAA